MKGIAIDGFLNIRKPSGPTSSKIVEWVRRWTRADRVGHGGTLDPDAEGVLPIGLGYGTRLLEFIPEPKAYRAEILLGVETDTYDTSGEVVAENDPSHITRNDVESALGPFIGSIQQVPPRYSALKQQGEPLHRLARRGVAVEVAPRPVEIYAIDVEAWTPPRVTLLVTCGKGTYIRSLAHDLGQALGCGASLQALTRTCVGPFDIESSVDTDTLRALCNDGRVESLLLPLDIPVRAWPSVVLSDIQREDVFHGRTVQLPANAGTQRVAAYGADGELVALLEPLPDGQFWQPFKVFPPRK